MLERQSSEVVIALGHGIEKVLDLIPAGLCSCCDGRGADRPGTYVFAKTYDDMPDESTLHNVIEHCKLAILLTCCDRDLLSDHLWFESGTTFSRPTDMPK